MHRTTAATAVVTTALSCLLVAASSASAAPSPSASCSGQLSQGATPHGASAADPGFLGNYVSGTATSAPGLVGASSSTLAQLHGELGACIPF